jgi:hypothetical protein
VQRKRRILLLLSAILIPTAVVVFLVVRLVSQETELAERRLAEQKRESLDQLRRELYARLQAIKVAQVNRMIAEAGTLWTPEPPIVFVAPLEQDRLVLPWEGEQRVSVFYESEGEALEFQQNDPVSAAKQYKRQLDSANTPAEACEARLRLGRAYLKAGKTVDSQSNDRVMLKECVTSADSEGISLSLYAAQRLLTAKPDDADAGKAVLDAANVSRWRQPNEAYMLKALLSVMPTGKAPLQKLSSEIRDMEQIAALAQNIHDPLGKLQRAFRSAPGDLSWMGYGDEPWIITIVAPDSFSSPLIMGVS